MNMNSKIKNFNQFNKKLHVFDFDDTLAETPSFEELALKYLKENKTVKDLLDESILKIDKDISQLKYENGRIFLDDPENKIKLIGNWVRRGKRVYLTTPFGFDYIEESMPKKLKDISNLYKSVDDKCIVTARPEGSRKLLEQTLIKLGLELPKFGIYMRPDNLNNAGEWKGFQICELSEKFDFSCVVFYDDNAKYIRKAKKVVSEKLPNLKFETVKIY
jgi:hypothetical protein